MSVLDDTYGCLYLAVVFTSALWAISCIQLWFYIENYYHTDKLWLKIYVVLIWIIDTVYLILSFKFLYVYFVKEFGNRDFLNNFPKLIYDTAPISAVISAVVQVIFLMRTWTLGERNYILTGGLSLLVLAQFVATLVYSSKSGKLESFAAFTAIANIESAMNMIMFVTDNAISLALVYLLWRRRSSFRRTENIIKRLVAFTIGTGLIVGILMIIAFIFAEVRPNSLVYIALDYCLAKMDYNCMLASLNARSSFRNHMRDAGGGMSFHLDDIATDGAVAEGRARTSVLPASIGPNSHTANRPVVIECRVDINSDPESATRKYDDGRLASDFQGDKVSSVV